MASAAELSIVVRGDSAQAERALKQTRDELGRFVAGSHSAGLSFGSLTGAFVAAQGVISVFRGAMNLAGGAVEAFDDSAIGMNNRLEQAKIGFTTMLGSAQAADAFLRDMADFAAKTPFEFPDLVTASQRMMAMGFAAAEVRPLLTAVGNAAAALGSGKEGIDRITTALGQMSANTKVNAQDMRQLTEAGIPAWRLLAEAIGRTVPEVQEMAKQGEIASDVFIKAFQDFSKNNYGDMMAKQALTFDGAMSTIRDSLGMAIANGTQPLYRSLTDIAVEAAKFVSSNDFSAWVAGVAAEVGEFVKIEKEWATNLKAFSASDAWQTIQTKIGDLATGALFVQNVLGGQGLEDAARKAVEARHRWEEAGQAARDAVNFPAAPDAGAAGALQAARKAQDAFNASVATSAGDLDQEAKKIGDLKSQLSDLAATQARTMEDAARNILRSQESFRLSQKAMNASQKEAADALIESEGVQGEKRAAERQKNLDRLAEIERRQSTGFATAEEAAAVQAEREQLQAREKMAERAFERQGEYGQQYNKLLQDLGKATTEQQRDSILEQIRATEQQEKKEKDGYDVAYALERQRTINQIAETQIRKAEQADETNQRLGDIARERDQAIDASNKRMAAVTADLATEEAARQKIVDKLDAEKGKVDALWAAYNRLNELQKIMDFGVLVDTLGPGKPPPPSTEQYGPFGEVPGTYRNPIVPSGIINGTNTISASGTSPTNTITVTGPVTIAAPLPGDTPPDWFIRWQQSLVESADARAAGRR